VANLAAQMLAVEFANLWSFLEANFFAAVFAAVAFQVHIFGLLEGFSTKTRLFWRIYVLALTTRTPPTFI
jgi:hypothetical protein